MLNIDRPWVSIEELEEDLIFLDELKEINYNCKDNDLIDSENSDEQNKQK